MLHNVETMGEARFEVEVQGVACGYHGAAILSQIDFRCGAGEVVALLGPNGSGKSTLIRALSGVIPLMERRIIAGGQSIASLGEQQIARLVATVPQEETHRFAFTVLQVAAMGRLAVSRSFFDSEMDLKATREALVEADCLDLADRLVTELSGGERQRALIARALAQDTPLVLLDEATSHLDVGHQLSAARIFRNLAARGKAVVAAVHDLNLATLFADRAILLSGGKVAADLPIESMIESPLLDSVYGVPFRRFRGEDGKLRLYPSL